MIATGQCSGLSAASAPTRAHRAARVRPCVGNVTAVWNFGSGTGAAIRRSPPVRRRLRKASIRREEKIGRPAQGNSERPYRSKGTPTLGIGDRSTSGLLSLGLPGAGVSAAHLCALFVRKLDAVVRRLRGIQPEQPGWSALSGCGRDGRRRNQCGEGHQAQKEAGKAEVVHSGVLDEFQHDDLSLFVDAQLKAQADGGL